MTSQTIIIPNRKHKSPVWSISTVVLNKLIMTLTRPSLGEQRILCSVLIAIEIQTVTAFSHTNMNLVFIEPFVQSVWGTEPKLNAMQCGLSLGMPRKDLGSY